MTTHASHAWPLRLRALSCAITVGVAGLEAALIAFPIAIVLWLSGAMTLRALEGALVISLGWGLAIAIYSHISPVGLPRRIFSGGGR